MSKVKNFKIIIEYDGSQYCGWQRQNNDPTIQETIEKALLKMTDQKISLIGSGRTDAGVHAYGQVANFKCDTKLMANDFLGGLNSLTPEDIQSMKKDNPMTRAQREEQEAIDRFLSGEDVVPHTDHHH